jgi:hypothetical protein
MDPPAVAVLPDAPINEDFLLGRANVRQPKDQASVVL